MSRLILFVLGVSCAALATAAPPQPPATGDSEKNPLAPPQKFRTTGSHQVFLPGVDAEGKPIMGQAVFATGPEFTHADMKSIADMGKIVKLELRCEKLTDDGLQQLTHLKDLRNLDLRCEKLT